MRKKANRKKRKHLDTATRRNELLEKAIEQVSVNVQYCKCNVEGYLAGKFDDNKNLTPEQYSNKQFILSTLKNLEAFKITATELQIMHYCNSDGNVIQHVNINKTEELQKVLALLKEFENELKDIMYFIDNNVLQSYSTFFHNNFANAIDALQKLNSIL